MQAPSFQESFPCQASMKTSRSSPRMAGLRPPLPPSCRLALLRPTHSRCRPRPPRLPQPQPQPRARPRLLPHPGHPPPGPPQPQLQPRPRPPPKIPVKMMMKKKKKKNLDQEFNCLPSGPMGSPRTARATFLFPTSRVMGNLVSISTECVSKNSFGPCERELHLTRHGCLGMLTPAQNSQPQA